MTKKNQKDAMNQIRWTMSRFPDCKSLNGIYDGPVKLVLTRGKQNILDVKKLNCSLHSF